MERDESNGNRQDALDLQLALSEQLEQRQLLHTPSVEAAFRTVPRHLFLPGVPLDQVYRNEVIVTKRQQGEPLSSSSQPAMMAIRSCWSSSAWNRVIAC